MDGFLISLNITFVEIYPNQVQNVKELVKYTLEFKSEPILDITLFGFYLFLFFKSADEMAMQTTNYKASFSKVFNLKMITLKLKEL